MATTHQTASKRIAKESSDPARTAKAIDTEIQGLYALTPEPVPFAPSLDIRAFLLRRDRGNLLLYSTTTVQANAPAIEALGGISRHYLNHRHEAQFSSKGIDAPLFVHESERESVSESYDIRGTFSKRHALDEDFEVIPTPGHTPGATVYLWDSGERRLLFTGDTVYLSEGKWVAAVLPSSDRQRYIESLELIGRPRLRRAGAVGHDPRSALLRRNRASRRRAPYRGNPRTRAARRGPLIGSGTLFSNSTPHTASQ
jgi:hypothetical protein